MESLVRMGATTYTMPSEREIVCRRIFDAPRELVFEAWTSCEHAPHWLLGPEGWTMPVCEIERPERLVSSERWGDEWPEALNTLVLTEEDGRTTMALTMRYDSEDIRDAAMGTGMTDGMDRSFDLLDEHLATARTA